MLGLKTLLRLVIAAAVITGGLYGVMEFGRPQAAQGPQADLRAGDAIPSLPARSVEQAVPDIRPSMDGAQPAAHAATAAAKAVDPAQQAAIAQAAVTQPDPVQALPAANVAEAEQAAPAATALQPRQDEGAQAALPVTGALSDPTDEPASSPAPATAPAKKVKTAKGGLLCTTFRSYNAESGTYKGLDGKVHDCKPAPLH
jgi:hypothetical protein